MFEDKDYWLMQGDCLERMKEILAGLPKQRYNRSKQAYLYIGSNGTLKSFAGLKTSLSYKLVEWRENEIS